MLLLFPYWVLTVYLCCFSVLRKSKALLMLNAQAAASLEVTNVFTICWNLQSKRDLEVDDSVVCWTPIFLSLFRDVCPNSYKQEGHRCIREETFDCTPPRKNNIRPTKGGTKKGPATVEEFVLQSTCKRITSEPARKICDNGKLEGKHCIVEQEVQPLIVPGKYSEVLAPVMTQCPEGYSASMSGKECEQIEYAQPFFVCPPSTSDLGDKCATFQPPRVVCPHGFALENDHQCVKTLFAAPIIEYSVTYTCTGKNCASGKGH